MDTKGYRFPKDVSLLSVRWYLRYQLSYRDLEEMLAERGAGPCHTSVFRWVQRFTPELLAAFKTRKSQVGGRWRLDETYVKGTRIVGGSLPSTLHLDASTLIN